MRYCLAMCLIGLATIVGCSESETGPKTTADELSKYDVPAGEAAKASQAAAAAAAKGN